MKEVKLIKPISFIYSVVLFLIPSVYFILITYLLIPFLNATFNLHSALSWFIAGLTVFVPLFILAILFTKNDGYKTRKEIFERLRLKKLVKRDWKYVIVSSLLIFIITGIIMGISKYLNIKYGILELETTPPFMKFEAFIGKEKLLLIVWLVMFFFNMYGEELLWRGYILPRQELSFYKYAWLLNGLLWIIFHTCFGIDLILILLPIMFILPYAVYKTKNTNVGILIHAILNGPMFVLVSLGIIQ
ncbi:CPBP family intramembrane glutamic endopeptidase [Bacteroidota bacterium]